MGEAYGFFASWIPLDRARARADSSPKEESYEQTVTQSGDKRLHTAIDLLGRERVLNLGHSEVGCIATLTFLYIHNAGKCVPHAILPFEVVFFHTLVIVAFTTLTNPDSTHLREMFVDLLRDNVIMFVSLVAEAENDIFETADPMFALAKFERLVRKILHKLYGIVGRLAFTVRGHHENCSTVLGYLVQILKVVFFRITNEGGETELGLGFLGDANGVFFSGSSLRAVKDDKALFLQNNYKMQLKGKERATYSSLHLLDKITRVSMTICLLD